MKRNRAVSSIAAPYIIEDFDLDDKAVKLYERFWDFKKNIMVHNKVELDFPPDEDEDENDNYYNLEWSRKE